MRSAILLSALAVAASAELVDKRQTSKPGLSNVIKDITITAQDLAKLRDDVNAPGCNSCPYSFAQLGPLLQDNQAVLYDLGNGTQAVDASNTFNPSDSNKLGTAITSTLVPQVTSLLNDLKAHYPAFSSQGFQGIVSGILETEKDHATSFAGAFVTKVSGPATTVAPKISQSIVSYFDAAISVYAE